MIELLLLVAACVILYYVSASAFVIAGIACLIVTLLSRQLFVKAERSKEALFEIGGAATVMLIIAGCLKAAAIFLLQRFSF